MPLYRNKIIRKFLHRHLLYQCNSNKLLHIQLFFFYPSYVIYCIFWQVLTFLNRCKIYWIKSYTKVWCFISTYIYQGFAGLWYLLADWERFVNPDDFSSSYLQDSWWVSTHQENVKSLGINLPRVGFGSINDCTVAEHNNP